MKLNFCLVKCRKSSELGGDSCTLCKYHEVNLLELPSCSCDKRAESADLHGSRKNIGLNLIPVKKFMKNKFSLCNIICNFCDNLVPRAFSAEERMGRKTT